MLTYEQDLLPKKSLTTKQKWNLASFSDELSLSPNLSLFISFQTFVPMNIPAVIILASDLIENAWCSHAGTYKSIVISINCFNKFFKSSNLIYFGVNTLVSWTKETW